MLQESVASELGARMAAMQSASDNAEDLADRLTITYNRARQVGALCIVYLSFYVGMNGTAPDCGPRCWDGLMWGMHV